MKKDILKGFTMMALVLAIALANAVVSANAQSSTRVMANVPFEFIVGDKTLSAGEYSLAPVSFGSQSLMIRGVNGEDNAIRRTDPTSPMRNKRYSRLVFHRYGENYFLAEVWNGDTTGRQIAKSRQERAVERELAMIPSKNDMAQSAYETVEILAVLR